MSAVCAGCGTSIPLSRGGRSRRWCSERCRKRASYSGTCVDCGARTYSGDAKPSERCVPCASRISGAEREVWTRETIIAAIQRWADLYGEPPAVPDWDPYQARQLGDEARAVRGEGGEWPSKTIVYTKFGSWNAAIKAAGFAPRVRHGGGGNELRSRRARAAA